MELYIHIPFCKQKCAYCDFASWPGLEASWFAYVQDVILEAESRAKSVGACPVETVYIGGGTPSLLPLSLMAELLRGVFRFFPPIAGAEFTSEANPGTMQPGWLEGMMDLGLNRLSLGMQAAQDDLLSTLGRIHRFSEVEASVRTARSAGIRNLSLDLMFGLPGQTRDQWRETLEAALSLQPEHLSCYGLIPEPGTPLTTALEDGRLSLPEEEEERAMYDDALLLLGKAGFHQYEISNFAAPGHECRHNVGYWRRVPYLGLGVAAASMFRLPGDRALRENNPAGLADYRRVVQGCAKREAEDVDPAASRFETMMLGLRMNEGVSGAAFLAEHGVSLDAVYGDKLRRLQGQGLVDNAADRWFLTRRGMDVQNSVLVELMED